MPRLSADQRAASAWRAGSKHVKPPSYLSRPARAVWREIVRSRPVDYFGPGATHLLESFVVASVAVRELAPKIAADPCDKDLAEAFSRYSATAATAATKLRLAISSSVTPHAAKLKEGGAHGPLIGARS